MSINVPNELAQSAELIRSLREGKWVIEDSGIRARLFEVLTDYDTRTPVMRDRLAVALNVVPEKSALNPGADSTLLREFHSMLNSLHRLALPAPAMGGRGYIKFSEPLELTAKVLSVAQATIEKNEITILLEGIESRLISDYTNKLFAADQAIQSLQAEYGSIRKTSTDVNEKLVHLEQAAGALSDAAPTTKSEIEGLRRELADVVNTWTVDSFSGFKNGFESRGQTLMRRAMWCFGVGAAVWLALLEILYYAYDSINSQSFLTTKVDGTAALIVVGTKIAIFSSLVGGSAALLSLGKRFFVAAMDYGHRTSLIDSMVGIGTEKMDPPLKRLLLSRAAQNVFAKAPGDSTESSDTTVIKEALDIVEKMVKLKAPAGE